MILAAGMLLMGADAFAQISAGAGYIGATDVIKAGGKVQDPAKSNGFYAGAAYDIEVISNVFMTPGVEFRMLSAVESYPYLGEGRMSQMGVAVPVDFKYVFPITSSIKVYPVLNVTFNVGISNTFTLGDAKYDYYAGKLTAGNISVTDLGQLNRFDIAAGVGAGVDLFEKLRIKGGYNWGAINLNKDGDADNSRFRNYFYVGAAFLF